MSKSVLQNHSLNGLDNLSEIGVSLVNVQQAIEAGYNAYISSTSFHPKTDAGYRAWSEIVAEIRQALKLNGWINIDKNNVPLSFNEGLNISVSVSSGDESTGTINPPRSKNPKGSVTKRIVSKNFDLFDSFQEEGAPIDSHVHYSLLYYFDIDKQEARFELSVPVGFSFNGYIAEWSSRNIFKPISFSDEVTLDIDTSVASKDIDFDIFLKDA